MEIKNARAAELVNQLIYNEIHEMLTDENYGTTYSDDKEVYQINFPEIYDEVLHALYYEQHGI